MARPRLGWRNANRLTAATERDEVYRVVRSNLLVTLGTLDSPTVVVTSALPGEGKTATTANLAVSFAKAGLRVVAVDVDLRHPDLHSWFSAHNEIGLGDVLLGRCKLDDAVQFAPVGRKGRGLYLLPSGAPANDPTELLGTARTSVLLESLAEQCDVLLLDTPPVLPVADTLVLGRLAAGAILVVESRRTPATAVLRAKDALTRNQTRLLGMILNRVQPRDLGLTTYGYGYGYGSTDDAGEDENGNDGSDA